MLGGVVYRSKTSKMLAIFISQFSFNGQNSNFTKLECSVPAFLLETLLGWRADPSPPDCDNIPNTAGLFLWHP